MRRFLNPRTAELFIDASARPSVARILERFLPHLRIGGRVPASNWDSASFWITNYHGFAGSVVRAKGLPDVFSYAAAPAVWLKEKLWIPSIPGPGSIRILESGSDLRKTTWPGTA
jgi:hypothetical protein